MEVDAQGHAGSSMGELVRVVERREKSTDRTDGRQIVFM